ncbi:hypothetical protein AAHE18_02G156200 [Arachis hypogaea]
MLEHQINLKRSSLGMPSPRAAKSALDKQSESGLVLVEEMLSATQCTLRERLPAETGSERGRGMERRSSMWRSWGLEKREGRRWRKMSGEAEAPIRRVEMT